MNLKHKIKSIYLTKNNSGMAMLEFMIVIIMVLMFVSTLIELGFYLKSEAIVVGLTKNLARSIQVSGELTQVEAKNYITKLQNSGISDAKIGVRVYNYNNSGYSSKEFSKSTNQAQKIRVNFRQDFKVTITGKHTVKLSSVAGHATKVTVIFAEDGKGENASSILN